MSLKSQMNVTSILEKKLAEAHEESEILTAKLNKKIESELQMPSRTSSKIRLTVDEE